MKTLDPIASRLAAAASAFFFLTASASAQTWVRDVTDTTLRARAMAVSDQGHVAVLSRITPSQDNSGITLFDANGATMASYELTSTSGEEVALNDCLFLGESTLAVAGMIEFKPWVAAIDARTGDPLWETTLTNGSKQGTIHRILLNELGHVVCYGELFDPGGIVQDVLVAAVRADNNGGTSYRRTFGTDTGHSLTTTQSGDLVFASYGTGIPTLTRTSNFANIQWRKRYPTTKQIVRPQIIETTDGNLFLAGGFLQGTSNSALQVGFTGIRMAPDGSLLSRTDVDTFDATDPTVISTIHRAVPTPDGGVVVAVSITMSDGLRDAAMLRFDSLGNALWLRSFGEPGNDDNCLGIATTPDGGYIAMAAFDGGGFRLIRTDRSCNAGGCVVGSAFHTTLTPDTTSVQAETLTYDSYGGLWGNSSVTTAPHISAVTNVCGTNCFVGGGSYGAGTAGTGGSVPRLATTAGGCLGYTPKLEVTDAAGGTLGVMLIGDAPSSLPLFGGTLLVSPAAFAQVPFLLDGPLGAAGAGTALLPLGLDLRPLAGSSFYLQAVCLDLGAPGDLSASNGFALSIQ